MESNKELALIQGVESLNDLIKVQCADGNWNYDPYMHGMANGLLLAMSLFNNKPCEFLDAPEEWIKDKSEAEVKAEESIDTTTL